MPYMGICGRGKGGVRDNAQYGRDKTRVTEATPDVGGSDVEHKHAGHIWAYVCGQMKEYRKPRPMCAG